MPPEMSAPPMVPPPPGVMSPSSPPGTGSPQADEAPPHNELLRTRMRAYYQVSGDRSGATS